MLGAAVRHATMAFTQRCCGGHGLIHRHGRGLLLPSQHAFACPTSLQTATGLFRAPVPAPCQSAQVVREVSQSAELQAASQPQAPAHQVLTPPPAFLANLPDRPGMFDASGKVMLKNLTLPELEAFVVSIGEKPRRARQLYSALYGTGHWVRDLAEVDGDSVIAFSAAFKDKLSSVANISGGLDLQSVSTARDGTHKFVFRLRPEEGQAAGTVETVLIPMTSRGNRNLRYTACLSTQVGCAMNCQFCLTGRMGLLGNLSTAQVVEQLVMARRWLAERAAEAQSAAAAATPQHPSGAQQAHDPHHTTQEVDISDDSDSLGALSLLVPESRLHEQGESQQHQSQASGSTSDSGGMVPGQEWWRGSRHARGQVRPFPISNIVFMGMGEPLHNYDVTLSSIDILAEGLNLSRNKIVVSTVGLADRMQQFLLSKKAKLALSLHATTDEVRDWIVPTNKRHPIPKLLSILKEHFPVGAKGDRFVLLEYVLLSGVNDSLADAQRLVELTKDIYCMINLIVFNPHEGTPFKKSSTETAVAFREVLVSAGRVCTLRLSKGDDEMAACGQLGNPGEVRRPVPVSPPPPALKDLLAGAQALQAAQSAGAATATP